MYQATINGWLNSTNRVENQYLNYYSYIPKVMTTDLYEFETNQNVKMKHRLVGLCEVASDIKFVNQDFRFDSQYFNWLIGDQSEWLIGTFLKFGQIWIASFIKAKWVCAKNVNDFGLESHFQHSKIWFRFGIQLWKWHNSVTFTNLGLISCLIDQ